MENLFEIINVIVREIFDSRGNLMVEVEVYILISMGRVVVLSGVSIGIYEVFEFCDGGSRYYGKGVRRVVENVNKIIVFEIIGMDVIW